MKELFKRILLFLQTKSRIVKFVFIGLIIAVLTFVLVSEGRNIDYGLLKEHMIEQRPQTIVWVLLVGLIALLPMLLYDFVLVTLLPRKYSKMQIIQAGFIANTFANIGGMGGVVGASIRLLFYGNEEVKKKDLLYALSKIGLFLLSGLSVLSVITLVFFMVPSYTQQVYSYWPWLVICALYLPLLWFLTNSKKYTFFTDLSMKKKAVLVFASTMEWLASGCAFVLIGWLLNEPVDVMKLFPVFIIASIVGIVSLIPGALGSFDLVMILGMNALGINSELAIAWVLFYRIAYYFVPFFLAVLILMSHGLRKLNLFFEGIPAMAIRKVAHITLVVFVYLAGLLLILTAAAPNVGDHIKLVHDAKSFGFVFLSQLTAVTYGFILIGLGRGIERKTKKMYLVTVVVLVCAIINTLLRGVSLKQTLILGIVLLCLLLARREFYRVKFVYTWSRAFIDTVIFSGAISVYLWIGIYNRPSLRRPHVVPDWMIVKSQEIWVLGIMGILIAGLILALLYVYTIYTTETLGSSYNKAKIEQHFATYGGNDVSHLVHLRDKYIFWSSDNKLMFIYRTYADKMVIMGNPIGDLSYTQTAVEELMIRADQFGYRPVFYEIDEAMIAMLHEHGFDFMKIGEQGYVDVMNFTLTGKKKKGLRAALNKIEREEFVFEMIQPPFSEEFMAELQAVSDNWLGNRKEKGFSLGFFDESYVQAAPVAIVKNSVGRIVAFATLMPSHTEELASIDLMRHSDEAPSGIMDFLFVNLYQWSQANDYQEFNLGMSPLSNVGASRYAFVSERIAGLIYRFSQDFYGFQGLRNYKNKFVYDWRPRYIAFRKSSSIAFTMIQLMLLISKRRLLAPQDIQYNDENEQEKKI